MALVQRIVHRYFSTHSASYGNKGAFDQGIQALGELIAKAARGELGKVVYGDESVGSRTYKYVDATHRVNQVDIRQLHEWDYGWNHEIESMTFAVEYRWGVPLQHLTVFLFSQYESPVSKRDPHPVPTVIPIIRNMAEKDPLLFPISLSPTQVGR
jgi:hypothetical protein